MVVWFVLVLIVALVGIRFRFRSFNDDFLSIECSQALNGIAILTVFSRHVIHLGVAQMGYDMSGPGDAQYFQISMLLQQLLVVTFLFFSGYGVMEQFRKRGDAYVEGFPKKRIFVTWANFAVAVACFAVVNLAFRTNVSISQILLSFTCYREIGNQDWYVFCILWCYAATWISLLVMRKLKISRDYAWLWIGGFALAYCALVHWDRPNATWWYDTVMAYPFGVMVSVHKEKIFGFIRRHYASSLVALLVVFAGLYVWYWDIYDLRHYDVLMSAGRGQCALYALRHNLLSCAFIALVLTVMMKVRLGNPVLAWCGRHLFPIYIYHQLFFLLARCIYHGEMTPVIAHTVVVVSFALTLLTARFYPLWEIRRK